MVGSTSSDLKFIGSIPSWFLCWRMQPLQHKAKLPGLFEEGRPVFNKNKQNQENELKMSYLVERFLKANDGYIIVAQKQELS